MRNSLRRLAVSFSVTLTIFLNATTASAQAACTVDAECDDGVFCNGVETCTALLCAPGVPVVCDDGVACTIDACDEAGDACDHDADDSACDDGQFCNGAETCDTLNGCENGAAPDCDDGVACTTDSCDEAGDACDHTADNAPCDDGLFCNGLETCDGTMGCLNGPAPDCNDGIACTADSCNENTDFCEHSGDDSACSDGQFCNGFETCNASTGCESGTPPGCDDGVACTTDACNESEDSCDHTPDDGACDDGLFCNGTETCNGQNGCASGAAAPCDDGVGCTTDACNETDDSCEHTVDDAPCDDGLFCNGVETCDATDDCRTGTPACDDSVDCTADTCTEADDSCAHAPNDAACDNLAFCDGVETCDPVNGCASGTEPCVDAVQCTQDTCNENADSCSYDPDDALCDDGLFCTGTETCDAVLGCRPGVAVECAPDSDPCRDNVCSEQELGCVVAPANDGGPCDDGNICTTDDTCNAGSCTGPLLCREPCERCEDGTCFNSCGLPYTAGPVPTTSDALFVLHAAVSLRECPMCLCDVNDTDTITALDGWHIVRTAVGLPTLLECPAPTSTLPAESTTTTTLGVSSTSTTTTTL